MILRWMGKTTLLVEAETLIPEAFAGLSDVEVARRPIRVGNQDAQFGDVFSVEPTESQSLTLEGDLSHVRGIGRGMGSGSLTVRGAAGPHLGAGMTGGEIEVFGDADDYAGAEMRGGRLRVHGRAGAFVGGAYPGSRVGMREGVILMDGDVGDEAGRRMRRGLIVVGGGAGEGAGSGLVAGSIFVFGTLGRRAGSGMKRGTIVSLGDVSPRILPSFAPTGRFRFPFLTIYLKRLAEWGFPVPGEVFSAGLERYNGDLADEGQGEILVLAGSNGR